MLVYLIRHGETAWNRKSRYLGRTDLPLSPEGKAKLAKAPFTPGTVYTSPLRRAGETAAILFPGAEQIPVPGLAEMDFGVFEGRSYREMEHDPDYRAWVEGGCLGKCPGGEDKAGFCNRVCGAFAELMGEALARGDGELVIVAHGGSLMAVMEQYALPHKGYFDWHCPPGGGFLAEGGLCRGKPALQYLDKLDYRRDNAS